MCLGHQLGTSGAVTSASLGRWASARLDPDATPDSTSSLFCVKYANTPNRPASPRYRVWPVHKPRRASHTPHPSRLESARGDTVLHGRVQLFHTASLRRWCHRTFSAVGYPLDFRTAIIRSDLAPGGIRGIDATTRNIPVPTGTACEKYRIRCPQTARRLGEYPTRRVVAAVEGIFSGAAGRRAAARRRHETLQVGIFSGRARPAARRRHETRRRGRGAPPAARTRASRFNGFLNGGAFSPTDLSQSTGVRRTVDLSRCVYGVLPAAVCASSSSDSRSCQALIR